MKRKTVPWYAFGLANLVVVLGLALGFWFLLIDPKTSVVLSYPEPFDELLFWAIITVVFIGFNLEFWGFDRLRQPLKGLVLIGSVVGIAFGLTYLFEGWGHFDPAFSSGVKMGNGFFLAALYVLFGFFTYLTVVINWDHWPWKHLGLAQPWRGIAEIGTITGPTVVLYALFALPNLAVWAKPSHVLLNTTTTIGVVYSIIIVEVATGLTTENWPWRLRGEGGWQAALSLVGNIVVGIGLYFVLRVLVEAIIGSHAKGVLGVAFNEYPAQIGVCWVLWMIIWANMFDNRPTKFAPLVNYAVRLVVTLALGIGSFALYYYVLAGHVLGEPLLPGTKLSGNALGFMNWVVLWILFYVVCLESWGLPGLRDPQAVEPEVAVEPAGKHPEAAAESQQPVAH